MLLSARLPRSSAQSVRVRNVIVSASRLEKPGDGKRQSRPPPPRGARPIVFRAPSCFHTSSSKCRRNAATAASSKERIREHRGAAWRGHLVTRVQGRSREAPSVEQGRADGRWRRGGLRSRSRFFHRRRCCRRRRRHRRRRRGIDSPSSCFSSSSSSIVDVLLVHQVYLRPLGPGARDERREPTAAAESPALGSRSSHWEESGFPPLPLSVDVASGNFLKKKKVLRRKNSLFSLFSNLFFYWFYKFFLAQNGAKKKGGGRDPHPTLALFFSIKRRKPGWGLRGFMRCANGTKQRGGGGRGEGGGEEQKKKKRQVCFL